MPKPPSKTAAALKGATDAQANAIADAMADKPYGRPKAVKQKARNVSISLPPAMVDKLQDIAMANKRGAGDLKTVSAIVLNALELAGY